MKSQIPSMDDFHESMRSTGRKLVSEAIPHVSEARFKTKASEQAWKDTLSTYATTGSFAVWFSSDSCASQDGFYEIPLGTCLVQEAGFAVSMLMTPDSNSCSDLTVAYYSDASCTALVGAAPWTNTALLACLPYSSSILPSATHSQFVCQTYTENYVPIDSFVNHIASKDDDYGTYWSKTWCVWRSGGTVGNR